MDITITAPQARRLICPEESFLNWKKIIEQQSQEYIYFRLAKLPPQEKKIKRCYIIYKGRIVGSFRIKGFLNVIKGSQDLLTGRYVMLIVDTWKEIKPIKARGHRNFRYLEDINSIQETSQSLIMKMYEELERRARGGE